MNSRLFVNSPMSVETLSKHSLVAYSLDWINLVIFFMILKFFSHNFSDDVGDAFSFTIIFFNNWSIQYSFIIFSWYWCTFALICSYFHFFTNFDNYLIIFFFRSTKRFVYYLKILNMIKTKKKNRIIVGFMKVLLSPICWMRLYF